MAGIETDRGPWVAALAAAGYAVYAVNPLQASRYRERHGVSGAKSEFITRPGPGPRWPRSGLGSCLPVALSYFDQIPVGVDPPS